MQIDDLKNKIILADSKDILKTLPDKCIDLVLTDPPYGIGMSKNAGLSDKYTTKDWDKEIPPKEMFDEIFRVSKNQIIFGGNYFVDYLPHGSWAVWDKRCGIIPQRTFADGELMFISYKSPLRIFRFIWDGMLQQDMKEKEVRIHPTQKPVKLLEQIIRHYTGFQFAPNGFLIADFFGGSCSTAVASYNVGADYICVEKDAEYHGAAQQRLNAITSQQKLKLF